MQANLLSDANQVIDRMLETSVARTRVMPIASGLLIVLALTYALFAGLRTVGDPDLGWQLATGRWIVENKQIPSSDILSYTAAGRAWIYPVLSQVLLYLTHAVGGFALLSWVSAIACLATILILARQSATSAALAVLAVPIIASRTNPRAEMFTEVLFAAFVTILWTFHRTGRARLWFLPVLMLLWTNLHLGFIAGLAMCGAYVLLELMDGSHSDVRKEGWRRLRIAAPFLAATVVATLINPWGAGIYRAVYRQSQILSIHNVWIPEWRKFPLTGPKIFSEALDWHHPNCTLWWLFAMALVAVAIAIQRRQFVAAGILATAIYVALNSSRMKGPFATLTVIVGGGVIHDALTSPALSRAREWLTPRFPRPILAVGGLCLLASFTSLRLFDLVTNRYYLQNSYYMSVFGAGESSWYPEQAATFLAAEKLPGNVFNDFSVGGFLTWKVSPAKYRDYIDGRSVPFSEQHFFRSFELLGKALDSPEWQKESDERNIKTIFVSLSREFWGGLPNLSGFCRSSEWRPVYLDAYAAIFVRETPDTAVLTSRLGKDCATVPLSLPSTGSPAQQFDFHLNAAAVLLSLGRNEEALRHLGSAEATFSNNSYLHYAKGLAVGFLGDVDRAEAELQQSLKIEPSADAAYALAKLFQNERRWTEAERLLRRQVDLCDEPSQLYLELGNVQLTTARPEAALKSFELAEKRTPFRDGARSLGSEFYVRLFAGKAEAWRKAGNLQRAIQSIEVALALAPMNLGLQEKLAELQQAARTESVPSRPTPAELGTAGPPQ